MEHSVNCAQPESLFSTPLQWQGVSKSCLGLQLPRIICWGVPGYLFNKYLLHIYCAIYIELIFRSGKQRSLAEMSLQRTALNAVMEDSGGQGWSADQSNLLGED